MRVLRAIAKDGRTFRSINGNGRYHVTGKSAPAPAVKNYTPYSAALSTRLTDDWPITILSADAATRWSLRQLRGRARDLERNGGIHSAYLDALEIDIIGAKGIGVQMKIKTGDEYAFENAKPVKGRVVTDPAEQGFLRVLKAKADEFRHHPTKRAYLRRQEPQWQSPIMSAVRAINAGQPLYEEQDQVMTVDGELDRYANFMVEKELREFSKRGNCDVTGKHSLMDFCRLALRTCARDGDAVILVYLGYPNKWGVAFQLIEGDYIDDYHNVEILPNGNRIRMGIELNPFGRKVAVWAFAHHPGDYGVTGVNSYDPRRRRIAMLCEPPDPYFTDGHPEAVQAIHVSRSKRAEETRGVPWITAAMELIHHIEQYKQAEITAARAQACKHKVYERDAMSPDGEPIAWEGFHGQQSEEMEPSMSEQLEPGVKVKLIDPTHPSPYFPDFMKSMKREVAMTINYCYNILFGDLESVNYSSLRGGLQNQREGSKMGQQWFIDDVFDLMLRVFLKMSLLSGALPFRVSEFERLYQPEYKGRRWQWVDPRNDAETAVSLIENKLATRSEMISDRTGGDFEETIDELDYEAGYIAAKENLKAAAEAQSALDNPQPQIADKPPAAKFNPNHDRIGEFSSSAGGAAGAVESAVAHAAEGEAAAVAKKPKAALVPAVRRGEGKDAKLVHENGDEVPEHIKALKLPPAWTDVKVSHDPGAALQAQGKDAKGRLQSVYSDAHNTRQSAAKFSRIRELTQKKEAIFAQNEASLASADSKVRENAAVSKLIHETGIRPGSDTDTGAKKKAYGATTLLGKHVTQDAAGSVVLKFTGKKGVDLSIPIENPAVAKDLLERKASAGDDGTLFKTDDAALRDYTHTLDGGGFKTKDFRTLKGTTTAIDEIKSMPAPKNEKEYKSAVKKVATVVSQKLGNTPTIALQAYIDPTVFSGWQDWKKAA